MDTNLDEVISNSVTFWHEYWAEVQWFSRRATPDDDSSRGVAPFRLRMLAEASLLFDLASEINLTIHLSNLRRNLADLVLDLGLSEACADRRAILPLGQICHSLREDARISRLHYSVESALFGPITSSGEYRPVIEAATRYLKGKFRPGLRWQVDDLIPVSVLGRVASAEDLSRWDTYDLTHWVFYLSDFGRVGLPASLEQHLPRIAGVVEGAIERTVRASDSDLLAELLMCDAIIHQDVRQEVALPWARLAAESKLSSFNVPGFYTQLWEHLTGPDGRRYFFRFHYHPHVALGLAALTAYRLRLGKSEAAPS